MSDNSRQQEQQREQGGEGDTDAGNESVTFVPHVPDEVHDDESDTSSDGEADGAGDAGVNDENDDEGVASTAGYIPLVLRSNGDGDSDDDDADEDESDDDADEDDDDDDDDDADEDESDGKGNAVGEAARHRTAAQQTVELAASNRVEAQGDTRQFASTMALAMQIRAQGTIKVDPVEPKHASGEKFSLPDNHIDTIKNCMASFSLPTPPGMSMEDMDATIARVVQQSQQRQDEEEEEEGKLDVQ